MAYESNSRRQGGYPYEYQENKSSQRRFVQRDNQTGFVPFRESVGASDVYDTESTLREDQLPLRQRTLSDFYAGIKAEDKDTFIAVLGVTGVGKGTFIAKCCKKQVPVGHTLQAWRPKT